VVAVRRNPSSCLAMTAAQKLPCFSRRRNLREAKRGEKIYSIPKQRTGAIAYIRMTYIRIRFHSTLRTAAIFGRTYGIKENEEQEEASHLLSISGLPLVGRSWASARARGFHLMHARKFQIAMPRETRTSIVLPSVLFN
jgi:hypothetical protein